MATANKNLGSTTENGRDGQAAPKAEYSAPKLLVVGTVQELTLGISNVGGADTIYRTGGGG